MPPFGLGAGSDEASGTFFAVLQTWINSASCCRALLLLLLLLGAAAWRGEEQGGEHPGDPNLGPPQPGPPGKAAVPVCCVSIP